MTTWTRDIIEYDNLKYAEEICKHLGIEREYDEDGDIDENVFEDVMVILGYIVDTPVPIDVLERYKTSLSMMEESPGKATYDIIMLIDVNTINLGIYLVDYHNTDEIKVDVDGLKEFLQKDISMYGNHSPSDILKFIKVGKEHKKYTMLDDDNPYYSTVESEEYTGKDRLSRIECIREKELPEDWIEILKAYQLSLIIDHDAIPPIIDGYKIGVVRANTIFPMVTMTKGVYTLTTPPYGIRFNTFRDCSITVPGSDSYEPYQEQVVDSRELAYAISIAPDEVLGKLLFTQNRGVSIFDTDKNDLNDSIVNKYKLKDVMISKQDTPLEWMEFYIYELLSTNPSSVKVRNYFGNIIYIQDYIENYAELYKQCLERTKARFTKLVSNDPLVDNKDFLKSDEDFLSFLELYFDTSGENSYRYSKKGSKFERNMFVVGNTSMEKEGSIQLQRTLFEHYDKFVLKSYLTKMSCPHVEHLSHKQMVDILTRGYMSPSVIDKETIERAKVWQGLTQKQIILLCITPDGSMNEDSTKEAFINNKLPVPGYVNIIVKMKYDNMYDELYNGLGLVIPPGIDGFKYLYDSIPTMWGIFGYDQSVMPYSKYTDKALMGNGLIYGHTSRTDLIDKVFMPNGLFFLIPKGDNRSVNETYYGYGEKGEEDVSPYHPEAYSIGLHDKDKYYAYSVQQIRAGFINEGLGLTGPDERSFKVYDLSKSDGTFKALTMSQVNQLVVLLKYLINTKEFRGLDDVEEEMQSTLKEIEICKSLVVMADEEDEELARKWSKFNEEEREKVSQGLLQMFYLGMYFRQWDGTPNKFPMTEEDTIREGYDKDLETDKTREALGIIYESMEAETKTFFGNLKLARNDHGKIGKSSSDTFETMWFGLNNGNVDKETKGNLTDLATYHSNSNLARNTEDEGKKQFHLDKMEEVMKKYGGELPTVDLMGEQCIRQASTYLAGSGFHYGLLMNAFQHGEHVGFQQYDVEDIQ